ncbi:hypothetical protein [Pseudomonas proteolytica]|uniref:hypothetical protein n=1 Tax=Pseudomonas proteolytica TaxID=219574 RepID=UPI0030D9FDAE
MHSVIAALNAELDALITAIMAIIPSDASLNVVHSNWSFPGVTRSDITGFISDTQSILINEVPGELGAQEAVLMDFVGRLQFLRVHTVPQMWGSSAQALPALMLTLDALTRAIRPIRVLDDGDTLLKSVRISAQNLRSVEARLRDFTTRTEDLGVVIQRIEAVNDAAFQLPEDLESLREARLKITQLMGESEKDRLHIFSAKEAMDAAQNELRQAAIDTAEVVKKADAAYSSATSQGLASAFAERSKELGTSMLLWVGALLLSLGCASYFGSSQLIRLSELIKTPGAPDSAIIVNLLLSVLSVGAPVWFAWLSTKQVGQRFRLSEDYAFKASVSKAYEGYRREAASIDPELQVQLLKSALARLDEQPLRFVEPETHGSPWQEAFSSDLMKEAAKSIPNFSTHLTAFVSGLLTRDKNKSD